MKIKYILIAVLALALSGFVSAGNDKSTKSPPNGRPFQEIYSVINALTSRVLTVEVDVEQLTHDIDALNTQLTQNVASITALINSDAALRTDLDALAARHQLDFDAISEALLANEQRVISLEAALAEAKLELANQIEEGDAGLQALVNTLELQLNNARLAISALEDVQGQLGDAIAGLVLQADALAGRVDALEGGSMSAIPAQCDTGRDPGSNSPWVVCAADQQEAWVSADKIGEYHAELICQELGYRTVKNWGGTCGNVCGYCQGPTSCANPGLSSDDRESKSWDSYNGGSDALGPIIYRTVQWICTK